MARARTTLILAFLLLVSIAVDAGQGAVQAFPTAMIWRIEVLAVPVAPPVSSGGRLFLALQSSVSARRLADGSEIWNTPLDVSGPMAASEDRLVVSTKGELRGLDVSTGVAVWTAPTGSVTAPPLVHGDWLFVASGEQLTCYRVTDGTQVWSRETGLVEQRPVVAGARVYIAAADGRVIALDLSSGEPAWEYDVGIKPSEPLVYGDRVLLGSAAKQFCSLYLDGRKEPKDWCFFVGAAVVGRAAADATHVYYVALDNLLRAHDRKNGAYRWKKDLKYRPAAGPLLVGESLAVPGGVPRVEVVDAIKGTSTMQLTLATKLVTEPLLIDASSEAPARIAAVTGGLAKVWTVTLVGPAPAAAPSVPIAPLTELPGQTIPIGKPSVLP